METNQIPDVSDCSSQDIKPVKQTDASTSSKKFRKSRTFKREVLRRLKQVGPDPNNFEQFVNYPECWPDIEPGEISKFLIDFAIKSQKLAEVETEHLATVHKLCKVLGKNEDQSVACKNEFPLALSAIGNLEAHPAVAQSDGINFEVLYKMMQDLMMGYPVDELNIASKAVIQEAIQEVEDAVSSEEGQEDMKRLYDLFTSRQFYEETPENSFEELKEIFDNQSFNPLLLPIEFILGKKTMK